MSIRNVWRSGLLILCPLVVGAFYIFWQLGKNHLIEFDEGIYAVVAKNIVLTGDFLTLRLNPAIPWFDKPPLYFWLSALFMKFLGFTSLAPRLPSALSGLGTVFFTFLLGRRLFNERVGFLAALVLASTTGFLYYSRLGMVDVALTFFLLGAIYFFILGRENPKSFYLAGLFLGMAFLTKNLIALLVVLIIFLTIVGDRAKRNSYLTREFGRGCFIFLLISLPWYLYMTWRFGSEFLKVHFLYHTFSRVSQVVEDEAAPLFWYVTVIRTQFRIWFPFLIVAVPWAGWRIIAGDRRLLFLLLSSLIIFLGFSASASKLIWFILPIYPFLALLVGAFLGSLTEELKPGSRVFFLMLITVLAIYYPWSQLKRIIPRDFNSDLAEAVEASDGIDVHKPLIVPGNFYVSSYYDRLGLVNAAPIEEILKLVEFTTDKFLLVPVNEVPTGLDLAKFGKVQRFGSYFLVEK